MTIQFLIILLCFAILDLKTRRIPNIAVISAIMAGIYLTGNWFPALIMFSLTAYLYHHKFWRGGDVKLFTLIGAFLGFSGIYIMLMTIGLIYLFRFLRDYRLALPVAPFIFVTIGITSLLQYCKILAP